LLSWVVWRIAVFKKIAVTVSAVGFVMLAVAIGPGVPTILAAVRTTTAKDDATLKQLEAIRSCAAFEVWFLDQTCSKLQHGKNVARKKQRLAHKAR
jgi:hypothetical protein